MLRFKNADLRPVITGAVTNTCLLILVKDHGVYFLSERGERTPEGRQKLLAYAVGCDPDVDEFDVWWELARSELGGDDFAEYFDPQDAVLQRILNSNDDLMLTATSSHLSIQPIDPSRFET